MSRIRSLHPGFFTDERLVSTSMEARLLFLGLGVEADDKGIFEWKPITLKMRLFPADNIDITSKLSELEDIGVLCSYEIAGRKYGAIRNFRRHQRPKTPNNIHPITPEIGIYVSLPDDVSDTGGDDPTPFPQNGEMSPQMEDGGGKGRGRGEKPSGFSTRSRAKKPNGWVDQKTPIDAANNIIQRIRANEQQRTGTGNDGADGTVLQLSAVRGSGT